eukprot:1991218-Prorocentrum_lima.AAC.2
MDGAQAGDRYPTTVAKKSVCRRAWWFVMQPLVKTWALPRFLIRNGVNIPQPGRGYCMAT